jgi:hypothetical protein
MMVVETLRWNELKCQLFKVHCEVTACSRALLIHRAGQYTFRPLWNPHILFLLMLSSLYSWSTTWLFPSGFPNRILYKFLVFSIHVTRPNHLIVSNLTILEITNYKAPNYAAFFNFLSLPNILLRSYFQAPPVYALHSGVKVCYNFILSLNLWTDFKKTRNLLNFPSSTRQMLRQYFRVGHDNFTPTSFPVQH